MPDPQPLPPPMLPDGLTLEAHERELLRRLTNHYLAEPKTYPGMGPEAQELHAYQLVPWLRARDALVAELGASLVDRLTIEYRIYLDPGY